MAAGVDRQHQGLLTTAGTASVEVNSLAQLYEEFKNAHDTGTARVTVQQAAPVKRVAPTDVREKARINSNQGPVH